MHTLGFGRPVEVPLAPCVIKGTTTLPVHIGAPWCMHSFCSPPPPHRCHGFSFRVTGLVFDVRFTL